MNKLFTQKVYYLIWIGGLAALVLGVLRSNEFRQYELQGNYIELPLLYLVGGLAALLFLLGLGYYMVIKARGRVPLFWTFLQILLTAGFCIWLLFPGQVFNFYQSLDLTASTTAKLTQDLIFWFFLMALTYSLSLTLSLLRERS